jgi:hypothetical protein
MSITDMATIPIDIEDSRYQTVEAAARAVLAKWQEEFGASAQRINSGECENFACAVERAYDGQPSVTGCEVDGLDPTGPWGGHVWVTGGSRHYDAEALAGVEDWRRLPYYTRLEKTAGPDLHDRMMQELETAGLT